MADKNIYWSKTGLTGGAATDLDSIDGTGLQDGEIAHVWISNVLYIYLLDVDSGAAESSPAIIAPATNPGDKRWILQSYYSGSGTLYTDHIAESTAAHGVEIDGLTIKDSGFAIGSDADGDVYYRASGALARLAKGTSYQHLGVNSGATAPEWQASANSVLTAAGDILYASGANTLARLAKGADNTKLFMNADGTAPEWANGIGYKATSYDLSTGSGDQAISGVGFKPSGLIVLATITASTEWSVGFGVGPLLIENCISYRSDNGKMLIGAGFLIRIYMSAGNQNADLKSWDSDGVTLKWTKDSSPTGTLTQYFIFFR